MKIQSRIIITIVSLQLILLITFGSTIYYFLNNYIDSEFKKELVHKTNVNEKIMLEKDLISKNDFEKLREEYIRRLINEKRYHIAFPYESDSLLNGKQNIFPPVFVEELLKNKKAFYSSNRTYKVYGQEYVVGGNKWLIITSAEDISGLNLLLRLRSIMIYGIIIISIFSFIISYFLANSILKPLKRKTQSAMNISSKNLHERIDVKNNDEIGQLAIAFNRILDRLEESFKLQNTFISNASHEIKNPLTMISGTAEIALLKERSVEEYKKTLESILQDSEFLNSLVDQLFLLAKTGVNYEKMPKSPFSISNTISLLKEQNNKLHNGIINILFSNNIIDVTVYGNSDLIISAIQNLIDNAVKFSGGKEVVVEAEVLNNNLSIVVTDNGPGVDALELEKISSAFYRSESVRDIEGHGIGLALTNKIVELHNGTLSFRNKKVSSGLVAIINLPIQ